MEQPTPDILYRYRNFLGDNRERTERLIRTSSLYFASPTSFNDPFDCRIFYNSDGSLQERRRKLQSLHKKYEPSLNRNERRRRASKNTKHSTSEDQLRGLIDGMQSVVNKIGVLCLSENRDDLLLWSHYAAGHTGLCLGFRVAADNKYFARAHPVRYSAHFPSVHALHDPGQKQVEAFLLTKAKGWAYEREWRIIDHEDGPGERAFHASALCEIVFGARMSDEDKSFVFACLAAREHPVSIFQSRPIQGSYALEIQAVEP